MFVENDSKFEEYISRMSKDGCWGGEQEITALCERLEVNIIMHRVGLPKTEHIVYPPLGSVPTLNLSFHFGNHFNSVVPIDAEEPEIEDEGNQEDQWLPRN